MDEMEEKSHEELMRMTDREMDDYYSGFSLLDLVYEYSEYKIAKQAEKASSPLPEGYEEAITLQEALKNISKDYKEQKFLTLSDIERIDEYYGGQRHLAAISQAIWRRIDLFGIKSNIVLQLEEGENMLIMPSIRKIYTSAFPEEPEAEWTEEELKEYQESREEWNAQFYRKDKI